VDVFTKLRVLQLTSYDKVLLLDLDLLIRPLQLEALRLDRLFDLPPPAAMKRGTPVPAHGELLSYSAIWSHPTRRSGDELPPHQQASGINAGVMLFRPDAALFDQLEAELQDWYHPEHYGTYMPEQEYLGRFFGTFGQWSHVSCNFNFEIDKNERIPHDFTEAHEVIRAGGSVEHVGASVLHYSGKGIKPWDLMMTDKAGSCSLKVRDACGLQCLYQQLVAEGPGEHLDGYVDVARLWAAMIEWLSQCVEVATDLASRGLDPVAIACSVLQENGMDETQSG